jgi:hypothetical protein
MDAAAVCRSIRRKPPGTSQALISVALLVLLSACQSPQSIPTATPTVQPTPARALTTQDSPPSASWPVILAAAKAKVSSVYTDAILTSVVASPYDYALSPDYTPSTEILRVSIGFIRPGPAIIHIDLADDNPTSTMKLTIDDYSKSDAERGIFLGIYDQSLKDQVETEQTANAVMLTPRDAVIRTMAETQEHANQVGLGSKALIPEVKLGLGNGPNPRWEVTYRLNPMKANGQLDVRMPVATFQVDASDGAIVSRQFTSGEPFTSDLLATPGFTATIQAATTALAQGTPIGKIFLPVGTPTPTH